MLVMMSNRVKSTTIVLNLRNLIPIRFLSRMSTRVRLVPIVA